METPISRPIQLDYMASAMKGAVLTSHRTHQLVQLFSEGWAKFGKIFDFEEIDSGENEDRERREDGAASPPPSSSSRKEREKAKEKDDASSETPTSLSGMSAANTRKQQAVAAAPPTTRIRRPSIHSSHRASRSRRYLYPLRILLDSISTATAPPHPLGIVKQNHSFILIYDHWAVAPTSLQLPLLPDRYRFQLSFAGVRFGGGEFAQSIFEESG